MPNPNGAASQTARVDPALEHWLRTEVGAAYDELRADPSTGIPIEEVRKRLDQLLQTSR